MAIDKIGSFDEFSESSYSEFRDMAQEGGDGQPYPMDGNKSPEFSRNPEEEEEFNPRLDDDMMMDLDKIETFIGTIKNALEGVDQSKISPYAKARIKDAAKSMKRAHLYMMDFKQGKFD